MTRRALGRGLSALLPDSPATLNEEMLEVDVNCIEPNTFQPRTHFDEVKLEELAQSIRVNGVIQPLLVRRIGADRYELIAGERRWRAAQRASLQQVPVIIRVIPDDKMLELALIENIQRQELNAIEEALAYKRLIETLNLTQEMVAQRVGRDRTYITNYLRLLRLPDSLQQLVEQEKLSMGHARALLGIEDPVLQTRVANNIIERGMSVRETERTIRQIIDGKGLNSKTGPGQIERDDANLMAAESKLRRRLGTHVKLIPSHTGKGGKIEVEYYSDNDLHRLYELIIGA